MTPERTILIIAGPNGAGKTTFAMEFPDQRGEHIAEDFSGFSQGSLL